MSSQISENVAIFWDYENCPAPSNTNGYAIAKNISTLTRPFGSIKVFKAYFEISDQSKSMSVRSELQSSGVSVVDCPHNGRKDVADKMILVDMLLYVIDNPTPCTIVLITSDRDFAYALSVLKNRHYRVVLIKRPDTHISLTFQASICFDWLTDVVNQIDSDCPIPEPQRQRHRPPLDNTLQPLPQSAGDRIESSAKDINDTGVVPFVRNDRPSQDQPQVNNLPRESSREGRGVTSTPTGGHRGVTSTPTGGHRGGPSVPDSIPVQGKRKRTALESPNPEPDSPVAVSVFGPSLDPSLSITPSDVRAILAKHAIRTFPSSSEPAKMADPISSVSPLSPILLRSNFPPPMTPKSKLGAVTQAVKASFSRDPVMSIEDLGKQFDTEDYHPGTRTFCATPGIGFLGSTPSAIGLQSNPVIADIRAANMISPSSMPSSLRFGQFLPIPTGPPVVPPHFVILVEALQWHRSNGVIKPLRGTIAERIGMKGVTYRNAGVDTFREYTRLAEKEGIIVMGGVGGKDWMMLSPKWDNVTSRFTV